MTIHSQQVLNSIKIVKLKSLSDIELSFAPHKVTAILGPNGSGKSTILHALACIYQPNDTSHIENYHFSDFFIANPDALWRGSELTVNFNYREVAVVHENIERKYEKKSDRWTPRYVNRPKRNVFYVGIDKYVPLIESERRKTTIKYSTRSVSGTQTKELLQEASIILNKKYDDHTVHSTKRKDFMGVVSGGLSYSALSMSAGEQKIFMILDILLKAEKYSLILIDELDLLLHEDAFKKLVNFLIKRSASNSLQVVFTTHRESIIQLEKQINIRHIYCQGGKSYCLDSTKPDAITRLTGARLKPIEVFVEDEFAVAIVNKIASDLGISRFLSVFKFGSAINCFTIAAGMALKEKSSMKNTLFVIDGDVYRDESEKIERIKKVISGDDPKMDDPRLIALNSITQFNLPKGNNPEEYFFKNIKSISGLNNEIIEVANSIEVVVDKHDYITQIVENLGLDKMVGFSKVVDLFATTEAWDLYVEPVKKWLQKKVDEVKA